MIEWLESIDRSIVLAINSWNTPVLDEVMWFVSGKLTWIPLYLLLVYLGYVKLPVRTFLLYFFLVVGAVILADVISSQLIKEVVERYRPSYHAYLQDKLHFYAMEDGSVYRGGQFGFVSSHAANFVALAVSAGLMMRKHYPRLIYWLLSIAFLVCFSRLYLGVHYLSDIVGGAAVGGLVAYFLYRYIYINYSRE